MAHRLIVLLVLAAAAGTVRAETDREWRLGVTLESDTAWRLRTPRRFQKSENRLELDAEIALSSSLSVRTTGRVLYDPFARLVGSDPDPDQRPLDSWRPQDELEVELREAYLDWNHRLGEARLDLRLGKQQVVWGQSFGLRVLDMVNAQDFREFILDDFVDARIPVLGARADLVVGRVSLQALVFPDFESDRLPDPEAEFALHPAVPGFLPALAPLPPAAPFAGSEAIAFFEDPDTPDDWRLRNFGFGFRAATFARGLDLALHYWDRLDPNPIFRRRISSIAVPGVGPTPINALEAEHVRVRTLGFSVSKAIDSFTLWTEGGISSGRAFPVSDLADDDGYVRRPDLQYALGVDWVGWEPLFANVQWIQYVLLGDDADVNRDRTRDFLSLLLRFQFRSETLFPQLFVLYGASDRDSWVRPSVEWRVTDRFSVTVGADLFSGPRDGILGQYAHARRCDPIPVVVPVPGAGTCGFDPPAGRPSRAFLRLRYAFDARL